MARIYINYRRQDTEGYVGRLYDRLAQFFDRDDLFMDVDNIRPGDDFVQVLEDAVAGCDVFLAMIGPTWLTLADERGRRIDQWDDFVRIEIASALRYNKIVIPVLVGRAKMPAPPDLPEDLQPLARRNAIELSHNRFSYDVEKLIAAIRDVLPARGSTKAPLDAKARHAKEAALRDIRLQLVDATASPLYAVRTENRYFPVMGEGSPDANIVFIGESPGKNEAEQGRPFVGPSGDILDEMLRSIHLKREDIFLTNIVLDYPGQKRVPTPEEIAFYAPFVDRIVETIQPGVIGTLGRFAMEYLLKKLDLPEKHSTITQLHGKLLKARMPYGEVHIVPLYHPAMVLYNPTQKDTLRKDFEKLKLFI